MESRVCNHSPLEVESRKNMSSKLQSKTFSEKFNIFSRHRNPYYIYLLSFTVCECQEF